MTVLNDEEISAGIGREHFECKRTHAQGVRGVETVSPGGDDVEIGYGCSGVL
jgi:hypothetical protein